jgi:hypothetical protein
VRGAQRESGSSIARAGSELVTAGSHLWHMATWVSASSLGIEACYHSLGKIL